MVNAEMELFAKVVSVVDWFATKIYCDLLSTREYTGLAAGAIFCVAPPVIVFNEQDDAPTENGSNCPENSYSARRHR